MSESYVLTALAVFAALGGYVFLWYKAIESLYQMFGVQIKPQPIIQQEDDLIWDPQFSEEDKNQVLSEIRSRLRFGSGLVVPLHDKRLAYYEYKTNTVILETQS